MFDSETVLFAGGRIDRAAHLRMRADALLADPEARSMVMWRGKALFEDDAAPRLAWLPPDAPILGDAAEPPIFLGLDGTAPRFAHDISGWADPVADAAPGFADTSINRHPAAGGLGFQDLRGAMSRLDPTDAGDAVTAKGIFGWHASHRFCARCGAPSRVAQAGWQRVCDACGGSHFPRTDPVVIMLVLHRGRLLMGRSPAWPEGMFSLLAGFMEPGESIEAAVRREVIEETGVRVGRVGYLASQPWPFPASLMIGCWAEALSDEIVLDPVELEDAFWISREGLLAERTAESPRLRPARRGAIAHFLIEHWLAGRLDLPL
ncbi:NAD(+) diphosphatase [Rhodobacteraceae bacterium 2CG4]|uniref:NAD(+) diphosphatase n=1 Tax=Halovulum marinum TaxID=2662447 RepID=A0A6L5YWK0_9RHOB|nr:NAD(+) diphosphatase [Halovulum marinum]MSU88567.1 NAD(+) diphosphatase [Halovulum marinum]